MLLYVSEQTVTELVSQQQITSVIERVYVGLATGEARNFPVVREALGYADAVFGFKSGFDNAGRLLGVKAGGLWPANAASGLSNHQSTVILFDPETGAPVALVRGIHLTALRTASASALSIRHLARADSTTLGILGAGGQSEYQVRAALLERPFSRVLIANRTRARAEALAKRLSGSGVQVECCDGFSMARESDVLITVTPAREAAIRAEWVRPGTHLACMGADTKGKQEVDAGLVAVAGLFGDEPSQAVTIGECQHAFDQKHIRQDDVVTLGQVIGGRHPGRQSADEITLFDSTGMGLQDLAAARWALDMAVEHGRAVMLN